MRPSHIRIVIPSKGVVGEKIRAIVDVRNPEETTSKYFSGRIVFEPCAGFDMPLEHIVKAGDGGRFIITNMGLLKKGFFRIRASFRKGTINGVSNPIEVTDESPGYRLYWGDIHGHTGLSDGAGTLDEYYSYAKDISGIDVCAATDHDVYPSAMTEGKWRQIIQAAEKYYVPGNFVTLPGYEFTAGEMFTKGLDSGHHCIYFLDDFGNAKFYVCSQPEVRSIDKLWENYRGRKVLTVPHHTAVNGPTFWYRWEHNNNNFQRLVEIYSSWGSSETAEKSRNTRPILRCGGIVPKHSGKTVQEALAKGLRLGFTAGSDGHDGRPGDSNSHIGNAPLLATPSGVHEGRFYTSGLTAFIAKGLTREAIWDALYNRRVYATTGARIILDFSCSGRMMGEEFSMTRHEDPALKISIYGTARIKKIDILRNNREIYSTAPKTDEVKLTFVDREKKPGTCFYYIRVLQEDGHLAWSSPVWVEKPAKKNGLSRVTNAIRAHREKIKAKRDARKADKKSRRGKRK